MAQRPLSPQGGRSPIMRARFPQPEYDQILAGLDEIGMDQSQFLRRAAAYALRHRDVVFEIDEREVTSKAS